jgi:hypothetical protein
MRTLIRRFALPLAAALMLSAAAFVLFGMAGKMMLGQEAERLFPFSNAHLLEEAMEGVYSPLSDPLFLSFSFLIAICAFGPSMFWGALRAANPEVWLVLLATLVGSALLALILRPQLSSSEPSSIHHAALFLPAACGLAGGAGIWLARLTNSSRHRYGALDT